MSKPQDGVVSRFLNRPISHFITSNVLLKLPIRPNTWTISILVVPMVAAFYLVRGDYVSVVVGTALMQIYSMLDGCDGEIARAKNLESKFGERLDHFCDFLGNVVFIVALGIGLQRLPEGMVCAVLVVANELFLGFGQTDTPAAAESDGAYYPRHRQMIERSGLHRLGPVIRLIAQLTRRDVVTVLFLILAILNLAPWILHLWTVFAAASSIFSGIAFAKSLR